MKWGNSSHGNNTSGDQLVIDFVQLFCTLLWMSHNHILDLWFLHRKGLIMTTLLGMTEQWEQLLSLPGSTGRQVLVGSVKENMKGRQILRKRERGRKEERRIRWRKRRGRGKRWRGEKDEKGRGWREGREKESDTPFPEQQYATYFTICYLYMPLFWKRWPTQSNHVILRRVRPHSVIWEIFVKSLICAKHCSASMGKSGEWARGGHVFKELVMPKIQF